MKNLAKLFAGIVLAVALAACTQRGAEEGADHPADTAPTESADEFVARVNDEFKDWRH